MRDEQSMSYIILESSAQLLTFQKDRLQVNLAHTCSWTYLVGISEVTGFS